MIDWMSLQLSSLAVHESVSVMLPLRDSAVMKQRVVYFHSQALGLPQGLDLRVAARSRPSDWYKCEYGQERSLQEVSRLVQRYCSSPMGRE